MASPEQERIRLAVETIPPKDGVVLVGWGLMAEWEEPNGERMLTRLMGDGGNPWQIKGYFHDGLNGRWPPPAPNERDLHHNPGHPSGWFDVS
jgi:hypothetical protein